MILSWSHICHNPPVRSFQARIPPRLHRNSRNSNCKSCCKSWSWPDSHHTRRNLSQFHLVHIRPCSGKNPNCRKSNLPRKSSFGSRISRKVLYHRPPGYRHQWKSNYCTVPIHTDRCKYAFSPDRRGSHLAKSQAPPARKVLAHSLSGSSNTHLPHIRRWGKQPSKARYSQAGIRKGPQSQAHNIHPRTSSRNLRRNCMCSHLLHIRHFHNNQLSHCKCRCGLGYSSSVDIRHNQDSLRHRNICQAHHSRPNNCTHLHLGRKHRSRSP